MSVMECSYEIDLCCVQLRCGYIPLTSVCLFGACKWMFSLGGPQPRRCGCHRDLLDDTLQFGLSDQITAAQPTAYD
jgi:hypothetical protein